MLQEKETLSLMVKEYISRQDAAELAGVNVSTVTKWMQSGEFQCIGAGKVLRIHRQQFLNWLNEHRKEWFNMAFIRHRGKTYSVVYKILDENGEEHTTSETFATQKEADKRKKEIEYKQSIGKFEVQKCVTLKELIEEYVQIYGHDKWGVSTYSGNVALINNYILPTIGDTKLAGINTHFMEKYYKDLLKMPAVKSTKNPDGTGTITESSIILGSMALKSAYL